MCCELVGQGVFRVLECAVYLLGRLCYRKCFVFVGQVVLWLCCGMRWVFVGQAGRVLAGLWNALGISALGWVKSVIPGFALTIPECALCLHS